MGINMGDDLLGAHPSNPKGHFEDKEFVLFNDYLVGKWDEPNLVLPEMEGFARVKYQKMISDRDKKRNIWGVKDPRLCITARYFLDLLYDPIIVETVRNDEAVEQSLMRREGWGPGNAERVRGIYNSEKEETLQMAKELEIPTHTISYEYMLDHPRVGVGQLWDFVYGDFPPNDNVKDKDKWLVDLVEFIDPSLNHAE
jgi:hypothetical protein